MAFVDYLQTRCGGFGMPITISWYIPQRVYLNRFTGELTSEDLAAYCEKIAADMDASDKVVHHVLDITALEKAPARLMDIKRIVQQVFGHDRIGWVCYVGDLDNPMMMFFARTVSTMFRLRYKHFETLEAAMQYLAQIDNTLDLSTGDEQMLKPSAMM